MSDRPAVPGHPADQRAAPRRNVIVPVTVVAADGRRLVGRTLDVSAVGLGLTLPENVHLGSVVAAALDLPTQKFGVLAVRASGRVAYSALQPKTGAYRIGLQWLTISEGTLRGVRAYSIGGPGY